MVSERRTPDRRVSNEFDRRRDATDYIDRKISELDTKRDQRLSEKLLALEKLFNVIIQTKAEANNIAISRIQGDSKDAATRCTEQVKSFNTILTDLRDQYNALTFEKNALSDAYNNHVEEYETKIATLELKNQEFSNWKRDFWVINIPIIAASITAIMVAAYKILTTYYNVIPKASQILAP